MEKIGFVLISLITILVLFSILSTSDNLFSARASTSHTSAAKCSTDEQCDNGNACDGHEFCSAGFCRSTDTNPCHSKDLEYCVTMGENKFFCHECRDDDECASTDYCNPEIWHCERRVSQSRDH